MSSLVVASLFLYLSLTLALNGMCVAPLEGGQR